MLDKLIPNGWIACQINDIVGPERNALVGGPFGSNLVSNDYRESGVPVIRGQNLGHGRWISGEFAFVSDEKARQLSANTAKPNAIVFTQRGTLGQVAIVPSEPFDSYIVSQSQMKLTVDPNKADPKFIYYVFTAPAMQQYIFNNAIQTGVPHTNLGILRNTPIHIPASVEEQRAIAHILSTLDDKIELNRQMNRTLDEISRTLFRSWFVDFDPVRAKSEGRQPYGMNAETADLFPDRLVDSEIGPIPDGWEVRALDQIADFLNGLALQKYPPRGDGTDLPVIKIVQLRSNKVSGASLANNDVPQKYVVEDGYFLFSWSGSLLASIWSGGRGVLNQHLFKVTSSFPLWFVYYCVQEHIDHFRSIAADKATTMGHINRHHLSAAKCVVPSDARLFDLASGVIGDSMCLAFNNDLASRTLAGLRDTLLPELLSGRLQAPTEEWIACLTDGANTWKALS